MVNNHRHEFAEERYTVNIVRNSIWKKKNQASDNIGKFHTYLKCRMWIHQQKSMLSRIWHVFIKLGYFWLFDVQLWNWFLVMNSYSTLQVCMKFAYIVTGLVFLLSYWILDNLIYLFSGHNGCFSYFSLRIVFWLIFHKNN